MDQVCFPAPHAVAAAIGGAIAVLIPLCSILSHFLNPATPVGKLVSYVALNGGKFLTRPDDTAKQPNDRGFIKPYVALALLAVCLCCAVLLVPRRAHAQERTTLADVLPPQFTTYSESKYGGCVKEGLICFAPVASVTLAAINLTKGEVEGAFAPGLGYGLTLWNGQWYQTGLSLHGSVDLGAQTASAGLFVALFNGYVTLGLSKEFLHRHDLRLPYAVATSF